MTYIFKDITGCDDCSKNFHKKHQNIYLNSFYFVKKIEQLEKQTQIDKNIISLIEEFLNIHYLFYDIYDNLLVYKNLENLQNLVNYENHNFNQNSLGIYIYEYEHDEIYMYQKCKKEYKCNIENNNIENNNIQNNINKFNIERKFTYTFYQIYQQVLVTYLGF